MYVPKPEAHEGQLPPGFAPARPLSDEEFLELEATYDAQFSDDQKGSMRRWYDHADEADRPATPAAKKKQAATTAGGDAR